MTTTAPRPSAQTLAAALHAAVSRHAWLLVLLVVIAVWIALKVPAIGPRFSDGHVYTYMGYLVAEGALPYRDFYYSSPPLLPFVLAVIGTLGGWTSPVPDAVPPSLAALDALLVYALVTRLAVGAGGAASASGAVGITAVASATMLLFSYASIATTDFASDVHWITTSMLGSMLAAAHARWALAGLALALALLTKLYAVFIVAGFVGALLLARQVRPALLVSASAAGAFLCVMALLTAVVGKPVIEQVLLNNLGRPPGIDNGEILAFFLQHDLWIFPTAALLVLGILRRPALWPCAVPIVLYTGFMVFYPDVYYLYFKPLAAYAIAVTGAVSLRASGADRRIALVWMAVATVTGALAVAAWRDPRPETARIEEFGRIVAAVSDLTAPGETIYGDSTLTPLVALRADRPIFRNHVDTNEKFVTQGLVDLDQRAAEIEAGGVRVVIARGIMQDGRLLAMYPVLPPSFLLDKCKMAAVFPVRDPSANAVILWSCG